MHIIKFLTIALGRIKLFPSKLLEKNRFFIYELAHIFTLHITLLYLRH